MCLLTFLPPGVAPDLDALLHGTVVNDDGHGYAIVAGRDLIVDRGMHAETMIEKFGTARREQPDGPALFHSRLGTHGTRGVANCHPFPVAGDPRTVIAHNGILPAAVQPRRKDCRSDTRIAAEEFLPALGSLRHRRTRQKLKRWMTPQNKMVVLTVDPRFKARSYILHEDAGVWDGGIWYSNHGYLPYTIAAAGTHRYTASDWAALDQQSWDQNSLPQPDEPYLMRCWICGALTDRFDDTCRYCGCCSDCGEPPGLCLCYTPTRLRVDARPAS
ncbi:MAG: hypothetical protein ACRDT6_19835 [Micromonosporaceae bacterium]